MVEPRVGKRCQGKQVTEESHHHDDDDIGKERRPVIPDAGHEAVVLVARVGGRACQGQGLAIYRGFEDDGGWSSEGGG